MSLVTLTSGGLDSTLVAVLAKEDGIEQFPLFIDYGQICRDQELEACIRVFSRLGLPNPEVMNLAGFGKLIPSGLTDRGMRTNEDAFLPGRNLLFLLAGCAYAYKTKSNGVAIGFLSEQSHIFPDQTIEFLKSTQALITFAMGYSVKIVAPLMDFTKRDVILLAKEKGIDETYSCHAGTIPPCGKCVSCQERIQASRLKEV
jgi:7-cyano-7-deazaguanine synthase